MRKWIALTLVAASAGALAGFIAAAGSQVLTWGAAEWSAVAAWVTALIALTAGGVAWSQLREARRLRVEQAQPYVVAFMEASAARPQFVDLVVRNFGTTAALNVRLRADPALKRSTGGDRVENVWIPEVIPVLAPGQDWRTLWDFSPHRKDADLPDRHEIEILFSDSHGREFRSPAVLDWSAFKGRRWVQTYGAHDAARALDTISKTAAKWQESIHGGLAVYVRDGDARDDAERKAHDEFRRQHEERPSPSHEAEGRLND